MIELSNLMLILERFVKLHFTSFRNN